MLGTFPQAGRRIPGLGPAQRMLGFERRILISYQVEAEAVLILRILYAGREATSP